MRYDNIEYNDEWQSVPVVRAEPVTDEYDDVDSEEDYDTYSGAGDGYKNFTNITKHQKSSTPQPVIKLQFILSIAVLVLAFVLKNYGGSLYTTASEWYFGKLNNSLVVTMNTENHMLPTDIQTEISTEENHQTVTQPQQYTELNKTMTEAVTELATEPTTTEPTDVTQSTAEEVTQTSTEETEDYNEY
ncbi:MAG: hypothetical protein UE295_11375 [Acutalibacteraceae bacterium]|nr:hypothetical protein [Acutalibacteraceae bacterium]